MFQQILLKMNRIYQDLHLKIFKKQFNENQTYNTRPANWNQIDIERFIFKLEFSVLLKEEETDKFMSTAAVS